MIRLTSLLLLAALLSSMAGCRSSEHRRSAWGYSEYAAQERCGLACGEMYPSWIVDHEDSGRENFGQTPKLVRLLEKIALQSLKITFGGVLSFFLTALGLWHIQFEAPRHADNGWRTCWLVLALGVVLVVGGQFVLWRLLELLT